MPERPAPERAARPLRIGIGGLAIEACTFSPHRSDIGDFRVRTGGELLDRYDFLSGKRPSWAEGVEWVPTFHASALPGGAVRGACYETLKAELLRSVAACVPLDGYLLDIHGAMAVEGRLAAEEDFTAALRATLGPAVLVSASMDLHGNASPELVAMLDLVTCFRTAPHEDEAATRTRAARNLVERLRLGTRPGKAHVSIPVLLTGERASTRRDPGRGLYAEVARVAALRGVTDAALFVGYAWADEPRCRASVVVTGDDLDRIRTEAGRLASAYFDARADFVFAAPAGDLSSCLATAAASDRRPFLISDSGDNPTAGGVGDVSWTVARLLRWAPVATAACDVLYASIVDPAAVALARALGRGSPIRVGLGGKVDSGPEGPADFTGTVECVLEGDSTGGDIAVLRRGGLRCIVTSRRRPYHRLADFRRLGLEPERADVVVVKIGYLEPELYELAAGWMIALTPGSVDQDLLRLPYRRLARPLFPFDPFDKVTEWPDLGARLL